MSVQISVVANVLRESVFIFDLVDRSKEGDRVADLYLHINRSFKPVLDDHDSRLKLVNFNNDRNRYKTPSFTTKLWEVDSLRTPPPATSENLFKLITQDNESPEQALERLKTEPERTSVAHFLEFEAHAFALQGKLKPAVEASFAIDEPDRIINSLSRVLIKYKAE